MSKRRMEQKEIDLEFFLYQLLEQWRVLLLVGLVFAIIFPIGAYVKNSRSAGGSEKSIEKGETTIELSNPARDTVILYYVYYNCRGEYVNEVMTFSSDERELKGETLAMAYQNYTESFATLSDEDRIGVQEIIKIGTETNLPFYDKETIDEIIKEYDRRLETVEAEETVKGSVVKNAAVGFAAGICLWVIYKFVSLVLYGFFVCEQEIASVIQTRNFGGVYKYPYESLWGRFAHSKAIYNHYRKGVGLDKIANDLAQKVLHENCKRITLLTLGSADEKYQGILNTLSEKLNAYGVAADIVMIEKYISEKPDSEYAKMKAVFAQVISHKTSFEMALELLDKLDEYNVNLIGTEFVEI